MANTVTVKIVESGARNLNIAVFLRSDGVTGELNNYTIIDPVVDLGLPSSTRLQLQTIDYNLGGFDAIVEFASGGVTPTYKWALIEGANNPVDFFPYGGLIDDSGVDGTGKIQLTTVGFTSSTDFGSIMMKIRKP